MYDEESGIPANARTSNLNEELGQELLTEYYPVKLISRGKQMAIDLEEQNQEIKSNLNGRTGIMLLHQRLNSRRS
ncbi:hypothetical protein MLD38_029480 [Melastoma candidum]|uniref:Uncharacterized protein n=1 Tax=Melastoma candidum TaxID=119954 RepID=A0ACB9N4S4_9MYRT|nr:hypothetical protein MLD38_029480 [Melastoma candidum]